MRDDKHDIPIRCTAEADLPEELAGRIAALQRAAFPRTDEFATQRWWHTPATDEDLWFTRERDGVLAAGVRLLWRRIGAPGGDLRIGGVANVCSHPEFRGAGAATACLKAAMARIALEADFGVLTCGADKEAFYARSGWRVVDNEMAYTNHATGEPGDLQKAHARIMICAGRRPISDWPAGRIDLRGPDW